MTKIYLIKNQVVDGVRFDLKAEGLPANFLGLAADLKFHVDSGKVAFEKMDWGQTISVLKNLPIKMVSFQDGRLVVGITFRSKDLPKLEDGVLASFYFKGQGIEFDGFERTVLSKFEGERVDLSDVSWEIGQSVVNLTPQKPSSLTEKTQADELKVDLQSLAPELWLKTEVAPWSPEFDQKADWWGDLLWPGLMMILALILLIFGLTIGKLRLKSRG